MQIYGYPGDRVDFVSKSGSAGSLLFGDPATSQRNFSAHRTLRPKMKSLTSPGLSS